MRDPWSHTYDLSHRRKRVGKYIHLLSRVDASKCKKIRRNQKKAFVSTRVEDLTCPECKKAR